jgi:hypothetical protein
LNLAHSLMSTSMSEGLIASTCVCVCLLRGVVVAHV